MKRLYLFDIDGTLLNSGGAGSAAMRSAFQTIYGVEDGFKQIEFTGRSDRAIISDALAAYGLAEDALAAALARFKRVYYRHLPGKMTQHEGRLLPGVEALLRRLQDDRGATISLGTGNFRHSAAIKLGHFGIAGFFRGGGFGDRTGHRPTLVAQGIRSANRIAGRHHTVFVIGDTVHDIAAARANGAVAVAVATGLTPVADLEAAGADIVLPTLESAVKALRLHD